MIQATIGSGFNLQLTLIFSLEILMTSYKVH